MGIHKYPSIDNYLENNTLYKCIIPEIMSKTYYYLLAFSLHFEEKENHLVDPRHKIESYLKKLCTA